MADGDGAAQVFKEVKISFDDFATSFNQYADRLKETESIWREKMGIWKSMSGGVAQMESSMTKLQRSTKGWAGELQNAARNLTTLGGQWNNLQRLIRGGSSAIYRTGQAITAGENAGPLAMATGSMIKAFGVAGKAAVVLAEAATIAAAGIFVLARQGAGRGRRAAGFGADVGSMTAAEIYMQRWVNPDAAMANAAQGRYDITSPQYVAMRAGLGMRGSFEGRETGALSEEMVRRTAALMHRGSDITALSKAHARGLGSLFSDEELIRLRNSNEKQIQEYIKEASERKSQYELTKEQIDAENKLITSIQSLESTFITKMQGWMDSLLPELTSVVTSIENLIKSIDGWKDWFTSWWPARLNEKPPLDLNAPVSPEGHQWWMHPDEWLKHFSLSAFNPIGTASAEELKPGSSASNPLMVQDKELLDWLDKQQLEAAGNISTAALLTGGSRASVGRTTSGRGGGGGGNAERIGPIDLGDPEAKVGSYSDAMKVMMKAGLTYKEAAGLAGEATAESGLGTMFGGRVLGVGTGDSGSASGMFQWHSDRWNRQVAWARSQGLDPAKPSTQYKMAAHEFITEWRNRIGARINAATTAAGIEAGMEAFEGSAYGPGRPSAVSGTARALREGKGLGPQSSINDLSNFQGAFPRHSIALNLLNQSGTNVIASGGILGAGNGSFRIG